MHQIRFLPRAEKYIKKVKDKALKEKIRLGILKIQENPYIGKAKKGDLTGIYGFDVFHNKTNYEIAYQIYENRQIVVIILVGTRENFYDELKKYISSL